MADTQKQLDKLIERQADVSVKGQEQIAQIYKDLTSQEKDLSSVIINLSQTIKDFQEEGDTQTASMLESLKSSITDNTESNRNTSEILENVGNAFSSIGASISSKVSSLSNEILGETSQLFDMFSSLTSSLFSGFSSLFQERGQAQGGISPFSSGMPDMTETNSILKDIRDNLSKSLDFGRLEDKEEDRERRMGEGGILGEILGWIGAGAAAIPSLITALLGSLGVGLSGLVAGFGGNWLRKQIDNFSNGLRDSTMGGLEKKGLVIDMGDYGRIAGTKPLEDFINKLDPRNGNIPQEMKERGIVNVLLGDLGEWGKQSPGNPINWNGKRGIDIGKEITSSISKGWNESLLNPQNWDLSFDFDLLGKIKDGIKDGAADTFSFIDEETKDTGVKKSILGDKAEEIRKQASMNNSVRDRSLNESLDNLSLNLQQDKGEKQPQYKLDNEGRLLVSPQTITIRDKVDTEPPDEIEHLGIMFMNKIGM